MKSRAMLRISICFFLALLTICLACQVENEAGLTSIQRIRTAIRTGDQEGIKDILHHNEDVSLNIYLDMARNPDMIEFLVGMGANLHYRNADGINILHAAIIDENPEVVTYLLDEKKIDINDKDYMGRTPLYHAMGNLGIENIEILLSRKAYVDCQTSQGQTLLMQAAEQGNPQAFKLILQAGANVNIRDCKGETIREKLNKAITNNMVSDNDISDMKDLLDKANRGKP